MKTTIEIPDPLLRKAKSRAAERGQSPKEFFTKAQSRHRAAYEKWLESELRHFEILPVTDDTTVAYAALRVSLKQKGTPIPANARGSRPLPSSTDCPF